MHRWSTLMFEPRAAAFVVGCKAFFAASKHQFLVLIFSCCVHAAAAQVPSGPPVINGRLIADATVAERLEFNLSATNSPTRFNVGPLPVGLFAAALTGEIAGNPIAPGVTSVEVSATNAVGTGPVAVLVIRVNNRQPGSGGGIDRGGLSNGTGSGISGAREPARVPTISRQPVSRTVSAGGTVTFSVSATGTALEFQWLKNGLALSGARGATLTLSSVSASDEGDYAVTISNDAGEVTSNPAKLTVILFPIVVTQPVAQTVTSGASVTFGVVATGSGPLSYQWLKDGLAVPGATAATLVRSNVPVAGAGNYSAVVTNAAGTTTSNPALLRVLPRSVAGIYFGTFAGNAGPFAVLVRDDGGLTFIGFEPGIALLIGRKGRIEENREFHFALPDLRPSSQTPVGFEVDGRISPDGILSGTVSELGLAFSATIEPAAGSTAVFAGFYQLGAAGTSAQSHVVVGANAQVLVLLNSSGSLDAGTGTVTTNGAFEVTTAGNARISGTVDRATGVISLTATSSTGVATTYVGANDAIRTNVEKLTNLSTRGRIAGPSGALIAGFSIAGSEAKSVLIRGIGPTLGAGFNIGGALNAARLEVFHGSVSLAVGNDWGAASNSAALVSAAQRVGAFPLLPTSRDAALLVTLAPGSYTAVVTGQAGASGVCLVEVYDASEGTAAANSSITNLATRGSVGSGDDVFIAGLAITGVIPKRLLIRAAGPTLSRFGIGDAFVRPQLTVQAGRIGLASNSGWSTSPDSRTIAALTGELGAFPFSASSADAALIVNLVPGAYTVQVTGVANATGTALIEVYEVPPTLSW